MILALLISFVAPSLVRAQTSPDTGYVDAGDLDPALFPLLDALLHVQGAPPLGPLRSMTTDGRGVLLHFAALALLVPAGQPDDAAALALVPSLLDRQIGVTLLPGSGVTYGTLAAAPRYAPADAMPMLLSAGGSLARPPTLTPPEMQVIGGNHVPDLFAPFVAPDAPPARPSSHTPDALARQAADLARAGMPLREPVWIAVGAGYRLVQPFTRRVLLWDPVTNAVSATDLGDVAAVARLVPDGGAGGALLADLTLRLMRVAEGIGVAIAYTTPRGTLAVSLRGTERYPAASVMKLAILAACEDGIARGALQRNGDVDVDALEEQMIVFSDNDAANDLIDFAGRVEINALMRRLGMEQSYIGSHFDTAYGDDDEDNYLTPRESLLLLDALLGGRVGDAARIRDLLGRSEAPGSVRDALPATTRPLYEKRGWYDGVENDVVRLDLGHGTTVTIAVFEPDVSDIDAAWVLFADLAHLAVAVASSP